MLVAKNCVIKVKENFDINDLKTVITEDDTLCTYPNFYKLLRLSQYLLVRYLANANFFQYGDSKLDREQQ